RSPSRVADTALSQKRLARTRTRSQSTTHPKGPTTRLTAPAYWKFESISLQRRVRCEPVSRENSSPYVEKPRFPAGVRAGAFAVVPGKARVVRQFEDKARPYGRQRRARSSNIVLRSGSVSVGLYSSTAVSPMRLASVGAPPPSAVGPLGIQQSR